MKAVELERLITNFFQAARAAEADLQEATAHEQYTNDATQDLLHTVELAPKQIDAETLKWKLHELRVERRAAKQELEVANIWDQWARENKKALDVLNNRLGVIRKIIRRQPNDFYCYKTDILDSRGDYLQADKEEEPEQLEMEGF